MTDPAISDKFAYKAQCLLAHYLKAREFYFSICPDTKLVELSVVAGLRCNKCGAYHAWLKIDRDETKELMNRKIPDRIGLYIKHELEAYRTLTNS